MSTKIRRTEIQVETHEIRIVRFGNRTNDTRLATSTDEPDGDASSEQVSEENARSSDHPIEPSEK
jgi:hypothetical protein